MSSTGEKVWQGDSSGFREQVSQAQALERDGNLTAAYFMYATTYYSHYSSQLARNPMRAFREFAAAKRYARRVVLLATESLSHGQCDVVGTILLRRWLWIRADARQAIEMLQVGLGKPDVPPHACALMTIGVAEGKYLLGKSSECMENVSDALAYEGALGDEDDEVQAHRQFCRVLRRASALVFRLGERQIAEQYLQRAQEYADDPRWHSKDQRDKIRLEWRRLHLPKLLRGLLPQ